MAGLSPVFGIESLKPFFHPRSVAIVGASRERAAIGHRIIESLRGGEFGGSILPVNPRATEIAGLPTFPSLTAIPSPVDLAIIAVPSECVLSVIGDFAASHVPAVILITAGFAEMGGVRLNLTDEQAVRDAFEAIRTRLAQANKLESMEGVLVQPMLSGGVEVMVGMSRDLLFGPLIAFGLGGIHVEIFGDVQFRVAPLTDRDATEMVRTIKGYRLLTGYRGQPAVDLKAIEEVLLRVSRLV
ncbi:MAG TPA: acetate--CoA ligase family protein [Nitrospira sp.]|nr:acetate--CoA ligase family protein [Nitrospira sp.]